MTEDRLKNGLVRALVIISEDTDFGNVEKTLAIIKICELIRSIENQYGIPA